MTHPHEHDDTELVATIERAVSSVTSTAAQLVQTLQRQIQISERRRRTDLAALRGGQQPARPRTIGSADLQARWAAAHAVAAATRAEADQARIAAAVAREAHGEASEEYAAADADAAAADAAHTTADSWAQAWDDRAGEAGIDNDAREAALTEVHHARIGVEYDRRDDIAVAATTAAGQYALEWQSSLEQDSSHPTPTTAELIADARPDTTAAAAAPAIGDISPAPYLELASSQGVEL